jgi:transposase
MAMLADRVDLVIGVDTHKHSHTAAVVSATGGVLGERTVSSNAPGYTELLHFAQEHAGRRIWAIEGTGSYGAGLACFLRQQAEQVLEMDRPHRPTRRMGAKTDTLDAVRAAREALAQEHHAQPRMGEQRAALGVRLVARRSAVDAYTAAQRQLQDLLVTAPEPVRAKLRGHSGRRLITACTRLRLPSSGDAQTTTVIRTLRALARRYRALEAEAREHERALLAIIRAWRPDLLELFGVGPIGAAVLLCAWSHPGRCRSEAAFARLAGVAPIPASSGQVVRHRLCRFGDRQLNRALHLVVVHRLRRDPATKAYAARRAADGKSSAETRRCLARYVARQLFRQLESLPAATLDTL